MRRAVRLAGILDRRSVDSARRSRQSRSCRPPGRRGAPGRSRGSACRCVGRADGRSSSRSGNPRDSAARLCGLMLQVRSSMSTNSVSAPAWLIPSTVAMNVFATVTTASPGPHAGSHQREADGVGAAASPTQNFVPQYSANSRSNASTSGPPMKAADRMALRAAANQLLFELSMGSNQIQKRNRFVRHGASRNWEALLHTVATLRRATPEDPASTRKIRSTPPS